MNLTIERTTSTGHRLTNYSGACHNIHGHNLRWTVDATIDMAETGDTNMPVDFKDISDVIDRVDHTLVLNEDDPLLDTDAADELGEIVTIEGDPTCEALAEWMVREIWQSNDQIHGVDLTLQETEKYAVSTEYP